MASGSAHPRALRFPGEGSPLPDSAARHAADREAVESFGFTDLMMMEAAGTACAREIAATAPVGPIRILCGPGNNGGDGWIIARHLAAAGREVTAISTGPPGSDHAQSARKAALGLEVPEVQLGTGSSETNGKALGQVRDLLSPGSTVVDALFGPGTPRDLGPSWNTVSALLSRAAIRVISIDAPSGGTSPGIRADLTLAIETIDRSLLLPSVRDRCGVLRRVPAGFPSGLRSLKATDRLLDPAIPGELLRAFPAGIHKHGRGVVRIRAGSVESPGAAILVGLAAESGPSGLTEILLDAPLVPVVAAAVPGAICAPANALRPRKPDAVVIGPGWGRQEARERVLREALSDTIPAVLDADALHLLAASGVPGREIRAPLVLTPHPGEAAALLGDSAGKVTSAEVLADPFAAASEIAARFSAICVLKLGVTVIAAPDRARSAWDGANPLAATGGSGDVLAGICGSVLAAGYEPWDAARISVVLHGLAARDAARDGVFGAGSLVSGIARRCGMFIVEGREYL